AQSWEDFKKLLMEEYCPDDEVEMAGSDIDGNKKRSNDHNRNQGRDDRNKRQRTGSNFAMTNPDQGQGQCQYAG
nr:hypothetical protein [Tanacetum cinerariifolium]